MHACMYIHINTYTYIHTNYTNILTYTLALSYTNSFTVVVAVGITGVFA